MLQKLPVDGFTWVENTSQFNKDFIENYLIKKVMKDIFLKLIFNIQKNYMNFRMIYPFCRKE